MHSPSFRRPQPACRRRASQWPWRRRRSVSAIFPVRRAWAWGQRFARPRRFPDRCSRPASKRGSRQRPQANDSCQAKERCAYCPRRWRHVSRGKIFSTECGALRCKPPDREDLNGAGGSASVRKITWKRCAGSPLQAFSASRRPRGPSARRYRARSRSAARRQSRQSGFGRRHRPALAPTRYSD